MYYIILISEVDSVLSRMQIIGVILCFRQLSQEALADVLENRIPYLMSSIADFKHHVPNGDTMVSVFIFFIWLTWHHSKVFA